MDLTEFGAQVLNKGNLQHSNMFSLGISCGPGSRLISSFDNLLSPLFGDTWDGNTFGSIAAVGLSNLAAQEVNRWANNSTGGKSLLAAMNNKIVESFLGTFATGSQVLDFFAGISQLQPTVVDVTLPNTSIQYTPTRNDVGNITHQFGSANIGTLKLKFRHSLEPNLYQVFKSWMNMVVQADGLRNFSSDMEATIDVNEHSRDGVPHSVHHFEKCVPIDLQMGTYSYDANNELATFEVEFAIGSYDTGYLGKVFVEQWKTDMLAHGAGKLGQLLNANSNTQSLRANSFF